LIDARLFDARLFDASLIDTRDVHHKDIHHKLFPAHASTHRQTRQRDLPTDPPRAHDAHRAGQVRLRARGADGMDRAGRERRRRHGRGADCACRAAGRDDRVDGPWRYGSRDLMFWFGVVAGAIVRRA
jgi:hypothetical protein